MLRLPYLAMPFILQMTHPPISMDELQMNNVDDYDKSADNGAV